MPTLYDQLKEAQIENVVGDKSILSTGLFWINTTSKKVKFYDGVASRVVATGSAGGGSLSWTPDDAGLAAVESIEFAQKTWKFTQSLGQKVFTVVKVPPGYSAGDQINMLINAYSPDVSGTGLLVATTTLIRAGTDSFSSSTNQRVSTNTALTFVTTANVARAITFDLTSSTGTVNGVAVAPGDLLKVQVSRGTDTSISEIRFIESSTEVTFS